MISGFAFNEIGGRVSPWLTAGCAKLTRYIKSYNIPQKSSL